LKKRQGKEYFCHYPPNNPPATQEKIEKEKKKFYPKDALSLTFNFTLLFPFIALVIIIISRGALMASNIVASASLNVLVVDAKSFVDLGD